jgi:predicted nucleic acid-binding protein
VIYFDSAYIAKCYLNESGAERVRELARTADGLVSCQIARVELFATVHRHLREGHLKTRHLRQVLKQFEGDENEGIWQWFPVTPSLVTEACRRLQTLPATVLIRAVDALHLACARAEGLSEIYTSDRHMIAAASYFELEGRNLL